MWRRHKKRDRLKFYETFSCSVSFAVRVSLVECRRLATGQCNTRILCDFVSITYYAVFPPTTTILHLRALFHRVELLYQIKSWPDVYLRGHFSRIETIDFALLSDSKLFITTTAAGLEQEVQLAQRNRATLYIISPPDGSREVLCSVMLSS